MVRRERLPRHESTRVPKSFLACALLLACCGALEAQSGFVRSGSQPIPGATLTPTQGDQKFSTVTDGDGHYSFPPLKEGTWVVEVSMFGFAPVKQEVDYASTTKPVDFTLQLGESSFLRRMQQIQQRAAAGGTGGGANGAGAGGAGAGGRASQLEQALQAEAPAA